MDELRNIVSVLLVLLVMFSGLVMMASGPKGFQRYWAWIFRLVGQGLLWLAKLPFRLVWKGTKMAWNKATGQPPKKKKKARQ